MKTCQQCKQQRSLQDFLTDKRTQDGYNKRCLYCFAENNKMSYDEYVWKVLSRGYINQNRSRDKEYAKEYAKATYKANPEKHNKYVKNWRSRNPDIVKINAQRGRIKRIGHLEHVIKDFTVADWKELQEKYNYLCAYCNKKAKLVVEHVIPISRGGNHTKNNIVPACSSCNSKKGSKTPEEAGMQIRGTE